jgi:hypothetical protein
MQGLDNSSESFRNNNNREIIMKAPIPFKPSRFVQRLDALINDSSKSQRQIAYELGYEKPNIITMFKQGSTRIPLEKVPLMADSLGVDRADLMRAWLEEYEPGVLKVIEENIGVSLSAAERSWIGGLRRTFKDTRLPPWDDNAEKALEPIARSLMPT